MQVPVGAWIHRQKKREWVHTWRTPPTARDHQKCVWALSSCSGTVATEPQCQWYGVDHIETCNGELAFIITIYVEFYIACLILRPVADNLSRFIFSQMQTNSRITRKLIHRENFNVYGMHALFYAAHWETHVT